MHSYLNMVTSLTMVLLSVDATHQVSLAERFPETLLMLDGRTVSVEDVETSIAQVMDAGAVAGLSCAIINDSRIIYQKAFGYRDRKEGMYNSDNTVFAAASFSKTVFAYLVVLLMEEGIIDLDKPLHQYLSKPLPEYPAYTDLHGDDRYKHITARIVLSHTTGFPNWRFLTPDGKLKILFPPGTRHCYSGEGIALLQMVVEEITGKDLEALARGRVFHPLHMDRSSYVWQEGFEDNSARPHDTYGRAKRLERRSKPDAAGSMVTTAGDYVKLLVTILNAEGQRKTSMAEMLRAQIEIHSEGMFGPEVFADTDRYERIRLAWGLGWGQFHTEHGLAFFHTGHAFGWQNYTVTYADKGIGVVLLSNSDNFEMVAPQLVKATIGDRYSPFDWLGYPPFDPSVKDRPPPSEPVSIEVDLTVLSQYVGTYEMQPDQQFEVKRDGSQLFIAGPDGEWERLHAESDARFFVEDSDYCFVFCVDETGKATGVRIEIQGLLLPPAKKLDLIPV